MLAVSAIAVELNGVVPSKKVIAPVGLTKAFPGSIVGFGGWTVAVSPTVEPTVAVVGVGVRVVVALFCPAAQQGKAFTVNSKAEKTIRWRTRSRFAQQVLIRQGCGIRGGTTTKGVYSPPTVAAAISRILSVTLVSKYERWVIKGHGGEVATS